MKMDFENSKDGIPNPEGNQNGLPQWILDNLESQTREETELPQWMQDNLKSEPAATENSQEQAVERAENEGRFTDVLEESDREWTTLEILEGIFRDFFKKVFGVDDASESTTDSTNAKAVTLVPEDSGEETSDSASPTDRYSLNMATDQWHPQEQVDSCANACQNFIINEYLGVDVSESELNELARNEGWYQEGGTAFEDIGNILETYGIEVHRSWNADFNDVKSALDQGDRVIVCVYNAALDDEWSDQLPIASANHAVEVIGVDDSDPNDIKVIVNDPGVEDGCGKVVSLDTFNRARETSYGYMVVADRP